jgi:hypothetical protein
MWSFKTLGTARPATHPEETQFRCCLDCTLRSRGICFVLGKRRLHTSTSNPAILTAAVLVERQSLPVTTVTLSHVRTSVASFHNPLVTHTTVWLCVHIYTCIYGGHGGVVFKALRCKLSGRGFDYRWFHWNFLVTQSFRSYYVPEVDSASNRNEYQVYFLGVKAAGA